MRISTMIRFTPSDDPHDRLLDRVADYARRIEASGFPGIWVGDLLGRGRPTLDPLVELAVLAAVTRRVELGIGVLQLPLRHPIELAHRVQSVQALSGNRLVLGVGSGSTKDDFDLLGYDYDNAVSARCGRRSTSCVAPGAASPPTPAARYRRGRAAQGGPPILIGAWRSHAGSPLPRRSTRAGRRQAATAVGTISSTACASIARPAAPTPCSPTVAVDLANRPGSAELAEVAEPSLIGTPDEVRQRLQRMQQIGFDEVLLVSHHGVLEDIERARDLL